MYNLSDILDLPIDYIKSRFSGTIINDSTARYDYLKLLDKARLLDRKSSKILNMEAFEDILTSYTKQDYIQQLRRKGVKIDRNFDFTLTQVILFLLYTNHVIHSYNVISPHDISLDRVFLYNPAKINKEVFSVQQAKDKIKELEEYIAEKEDEDRLVAVNGLRKIFKNNRELISYLYHNFDFEKAEQRIMDKYGISEHNYFTVDVNKLIKPVTLNELINLNKNNINFDDKLTDYIVLARYNELKSKY